jgi:hypothetical protein
MWIVRKDKTEQNTNTGKKHGKPRALPAFPPTTTPDRRPLLLPTNLLIDQCAHNPPLSSLPRQMSLMPLLQCLPHTDSAYSSIPLPPAADVATSSASPLVQFRFCIRYSEHCRCSRLSIAGTCPQRAASRPSSTSGTCLCAVPARSPSLAA